MKWKSAVSVIVLPLGGWWFLAAAAPAELVQSGCDIEADYAAILLKERSAGARALSYGVQFDPSGMTFHLPPEYYAPDWSQIEEISIEYNEAKSSSGFVKVKLHSTSGEASTQFVGTVQRSCWELVKEYLHRSVASRGIIVQLKDRVAVHRGAENR